MKLRKKELFFFAVLAAAALIIQALMSRQEKKTDYGSIRITVGGEEFGVYSLGEDQKISINGTNTCRIRDGKAKMIEATCPDHLCIHQSEIDSRGGFIICLPNEVVVEALPSAQAQTEEDALDAVS